ncbi:MAG: arsenate reductase ArsC [Saprospiraceae bacterium]|nr:arsenate reductase ArsC [Saprospiraceae bacterium]
MTPKVLFLCVHNSARSQMAEAYLKKLGGDRFHVESAGLEPGKLNRLAIEVMREEDIDISNNATKDVFEFFNEGKIFDYLITVCDAKASERCPVFPGLFEKINWSFEDPSSFTGSHEERLAKTREVRNKIKQSVQNFINIHSTK